MKRLMLLATVAYGILAAADPAAEKHLIDLAKRPASASLSRTLTQTFGEKALAEGAAHASHGPEFLFAVRSPSKPSLFVDGAPVHGLRPVPESNLWIALTRLETGTSHTFYFLAGGKPCLRCLFDTPPDPGQLETCETAGIIGPIVNIIAGFQATEAIKILTDNLDAINPALITIEAWTNHIHQMSLAKLSDGCLCCRDHNFEFLSGKLSLSTVALCGRNAVQIRPKIKGKKFDLNQIAARLKDMGQLEKSEFMLRLTIPDFQLTIFPDARTIIKGTEEKDIARAIYAKYIGH